MKQIIFLRPAPYSDSVAGHDLITSFELAGLGLADPEINESTQEVLEKIRKIKEQYSPTIIYTSPSARTIETAKIFNLPVVVDQNLREILFSLKESVPEKIIANPRMVDVNKLRLELMKSFAAGTTKEKPGKVIHRMNSFYQEIASSAEECILCISHAFFMKCCEIFYRSDREIVDTSIFSSGYDWSLKPYEFLGGFIILIDQEGKIRVDAL